MEDDLADEERGADHDEHAAQEEEQQGDAAERGRALDLAADLRELGPGQIHVGRYEPDQRVSRSAELLAQAGRCGLSVLRR